MSYQLHNASVLVIDDMQPMLSLVVSVLEFFGFRNVMSAHDAAEGFEKFCQHSPDIVITDWLMEPFDGIELIEKIRNDERSPNRFVPIILMTGYSHRMRVEQARDMGVTEFLVKPFNARDLYTRIEQLIEKPRRFVELGTFFGPDRRRRKPDGYGGPQRREADEFRAISKMGKGEAAGLLKDLKDQAKAAGAKQDDKKDGKKR